MPEGDTLARTAAGLRPWLVGRAVTAARAAVPGPRIERVVGATVTDVEAVGKNLLIRFDNGLEVRTHLRMHGSWHRYRPGERWRRAPARARLVLEVPGSVAVCFDAPVVELFERRAEAVHPSLVAARAGPARARPGPRRGDPPAARPRAAGPRRGRGAARPAGPRRDRQRGQERGPVAGRLLALDGGRRSRRRRAPAARRAGARHPPRGRRNRSPATPRLPSRRSAMPSLRDQSCASSTRGRTCRG